MTDTITLFKNLNLNPDETNSAEALSSILPLLQKSNTNEEKSLILEKIGDMARVDGNRDAIGKIDNMLDYIVSLLDFNDVSQLPVVSFAARALGNLSFEHATNVKAIMDKGEAIDKLVAILNNKSANAQLQRNAAGAIANIASWEHAQQKIGEVGAIEAIFPLVSSDETAVQIMSARAISNIAENKLNQDKMREAGYIPVLTQLCFDPESTAAKNDNQLYVLDALTTICEANSTNSKAFAEQTDALANLYKLCTAKAADEELLEKANELLSILMETDDAAPLFYKTKICENILKDEKVFSDPANNLLGLKVLYHTSARQAPDEWIVTLFSNFKKFQALLDCADNEAVLRSLGILGNVAKKDEYCEEMIKNGILDAIVNVVQVEDMKTVELVKIQHMAMGALRNLALPKSCKMKLVTTDNLVKKLLALLKSSNAPVVFQSVTTLKVLCQGGEEISSILNEQGLIDELLTICDAELQAEHVRIHLETARTLAVLCDIAKYREKIATPTGIKGLLKLFDTVWDILIAEGAKALSILSRNGTSILLLGIAQVLTLYKAQFRPAIIDGGCIPKLVEALNKNTQVQMLAIVALANLTAEPKGRIAIAGAGAKSILTTLSNGDASAPTTPVAKKILDLLPDNETETEKIVEIPNNEEKSESK